MRRWARKRTYGMVLLGCWVLNQALGTSWYICSRDSSHNPGKRCQDLHFVFRDPDSAREMGGNLGHVGRCGPFDGGTGRAAHVPSQLLLEAESFDLPHLLEVGKEGVLD